MHETSVRLFNNVTLLKNGSVCLNTPTSPTQQHWLNQQREFEAGQSVYLTNDSSRNFVQALFLQFHLI